MLEYFLLIFFVVGCCLYIVSNEFLLREVWLKRLYEPVTMTADAQRTVFVVGLGGLMLALMSLLLAHRLAQDSLHLVFPRHLVRLWQGVKQGLSTVTGPVDGKEE